MSLPLPRQDASTILAQCGMVMLLRTINHAGGKEFRIVDVEHIGTDRAELFYGTDAQDAWNVWTFRLSTIGPMQRLLMDLCSEDGTR